MNLLPYVLLVEGVDRLGDGDASGRRARGELCADEDADEKADCGKGCEG